MTLVMKAAGPRPLGPLVRLPDLIQRDGVLESLVVPGAAAGAAGASTLVDFATPVADLKKVSKFRVLKMNTHLGFE